MVVIRQCGVLTSFSTVLKCWCHVFTSLCSSLTKMCNSVGAVSLCLLELTHIHTGLWPVVICPTRAYTQDSGQLYEDHKLQSVTTRDLEHEGHDSYLAL